jgi:hypothetical protein
MTLTDSLNDFIQRLADCDDLVIAAHRQDMNGAYLFSPAQREQITVAAFLNLFISWEGFLEDALTKYMAGIAPISGNQVVRYVAPLSQSEAKLMIIGINKYFDYANHENIKRIANLYFQNGYPIEPHISSISTDLSDLRTMRNSSAHISSTTQKALEALAQRTFSIPKPGISLYSLLTSTLPGSNGNQTVFKNSQQKLLSAAALIANG